ncbi:MAG: hypothetical protein M3Y76_13345, partial [Chloroflexota bacterium]|nr:hypothetical protein [Chloroflexota bacterium]
MGTSIAYHLAKQAGIR